MTAGFAYAKPAVRRHANFHKLRDELISCAGYNFIRRGLHEKVY